MPIEGKDLPLLRFTALTGILGPFLFGGTIVLLTVLQYDFMRSLRWEPLRVIDWPSGLALGPYGLWMTAAFAAGGLALMAFGVSLRRLFPKNVAGLLFFLSGIAMLLLTSPTDPTYRSTPATFHGMLHDGAYVLLGVGAVPGLVLLALEFRRHPEWRAHALVTWLALALIVPSFIVKGVGFYVFLLAILGWYELTSVRLWRLLRARVE